MAKGAFLTFRKTKKNNKLKDQIWLKNLKKKHVLTLHTFEMIPLSKPTICRLLEQFYTHMTKVQSFGIPLQICGFDILGSARTGSGKTIAFAVPIIEFVQALKWNFKNGLASIILSPTRELTLQSYYLIKDLLKYHSHGIAIVMGGTNRKTEAEKILKGISILTATPGRLLDHLKITKGLKLKHLQFLVLDEADRCLDIGFQEEILEILKVLPKERQTVMFSATQSSKLCNLAKISFRKKPIYLGIDDNREESMIPGVKQGFTICKPEEKLIILMTLLKKNRKKKIITFFSSCNEVKFYSSLLKKIGFDILGLHGKQKQFKRTSTFFTFCKKSKAILFCTDVAARGLDIPAVDWIIQFSPPMDLKEYVHRVGRTGRGLTNEGLTLIFLLPSEIGILKYLEKKKLSLKEFKIPQRNFSVIQSKLENLVSNNFYLKYLAKEGLKSFLHSYTNYHLKDVFNLRKVNIRSVSKGFGFKVFPEKDFKFQV
mmetsp:Transcript_35428/g.70893  ORF Transcript_35428/g.70893 Transcript_35428/m.70893 type:complete len:485 (+) Transcript_35428:1263-2717(+)